MHNVVTIKHLRNKPYPDLWPTRPFESIIHGLFNNQPSSVRHGQYHYAIKSDLPGPTFSVIVQPNKSILYDTTSKSKADNETFMRWFELNTINLHRLSESGFGGTIVGKMGKIDTFEQQTDFFCVYYVVQDKKVIVDERSIDTCLKIRDNLFSDGVITIPVTSVVSVNVDKVDESIKCRELFAGISGKVVGIPLQKIEPRVADDGNEFAEPRLFSTDVHMRFSAFKLDTGKK